MRAQDQVIDYAYPKNFAEPLHAMFVGAHTGVYHIVDGLVVHYYIEGFPSGQWTLTFQSDHHGPKFKLIFYINSVHAWSSTVMSAGRAPVRGP